MVVFWVIFCAELFLAWRAARWGFMNESLQTIGVTVLLNAGGIAATRTIWARGLKALVDQLALVAVFTAIGGASLGYSWLVWARSLVFLDLAPGVPEQMHPANQPIWP
jgi:hypothetical protein